MKISTSFKKFSIQKLSLNFLSVIIPTARLHSHRGEEL